jgi:hypothetical protein
MAICLFSALNKACFKLLPDVYFIRNYVVVLVLVAKSDLPYKAALYGDSPFATAPNEACFSLFDDIYYIRN